MIRILVYEDESEVVERLVAAFAKGLEPGEEIEIIWFETGFEESIPEEADVADDLKPKVVWFDFHSDPKREHPIYPIKVEAGHEPWRIHIRAQSSPTWPPNERAKSEWHQEEFRGVILDIYYESAPGTLTAVGPDFAAWFAQAKFRGPQSVLTRRGRTIGGFRGYKRFHKKEDPNWDVECVDYTLLKLRNEMAKPGRIEAFHVDYLGRNPTQFISEFNIQCTDATRRPNKRATGRVTKRWTALYFGSHPNVGEFLCKYFGLELFKAVPMAELANVMVELNQLRSEKPRVVWLDLGEDAILGNDGAINLTDTKYVERDADDNVTKEIEIFPPDGAHNLGANAVFFILAKEELVSRAVMERLDRCNVFFVQRSEILEYPHIWAATTVADLENAFENYSMEYHSAQGEEVEKEIRAGWKISFRRGSLNERSWNKKARLPDGTLWPEITIEAGFPPGTTSERTSVGGSVTDTIRIPALPWPDRLREAASLVVKNVSPVLMIAKSIDRIHGTLGVPVSFAAWVSPDTAKKINQGFGTETRELVKQLTVPKNPLATAEISERQAHFVTRQT